MKKILFPVLSLAVAMSLNAAIVANVDGESITDNDVSTVLNAAMPGFDYSKLQPDMKKRVIDDLINRKLLLKDAKASGVEKDAEYSKAIDMARESITLDLYMKKIFDSIKVSDNELKDFYNKNKDRFNQPASAKASHILVGDEKAANAIIAQLKGLKGDALSKKFAEIAQKESIDKGSAANGGELGWFGQSQMVKPFADAVFSMTKGSISTKPVQSQFGYHVILKEDSKAAGVVPFDQVKTQIDQAVKMEKFQSAIKQKSDTLRTKAKIEYK
ncbi:peptidyl-prolyl cis-trans isomerase [Campylobacter sp. faydin G-24]|uniref:peptidylprolyl isomerase n=1 Tax=Campylobacter anatolicus TaxID=2829105 RepID=A0ABS5HHT9_9BACT|nr:peptidyl-prolyl cis-trans isomerase [Campylobacter anatolicus]MBR8462046.1 peptidyl-prolyl cis-trans isomerase [Campylobacter anatolicus]MBR8463836.1 peptidyl-prolyl cis-trans isomerase [Campylobacter anatolicus]MBR8464867.1 peptidyl-prolyl cis-trans isomerase [Campylobacter anatolicus]